VPADDFTDPAVTAISSHLDSMIVLSRSMAAEGMYPAIDALRSSSILLDPIVVGEEHYRIAEQVRETIAHYMELQDIISLLGIEELSTRDRLIVMRARRLGDRYRSWIRSKAARRFLTGPSTSGRRVLSIWSVRLTRRALRILRRVMRRNLYETCHYHSHCRRHR